MMIIWERRQTRIDRRVRPACPCSGNDRHILTSRSLLSCQSQPRENIWRDIILLKAVFLTTLDSQWLCGQVSVSMGNESQKETQTLAAWAWQENQWRILSDNMPQTAWWIRLCLDTLLPNRKIDYNGSNTTLKKGYLTQDYQEKYGHFQGLLYSAFVSRIYKSCIGKEVAMSSFI